MKLKRWLADRWVMGVALLVLGYLSLPILVVAGLSFNRPSSRLSYDFNEFTLDNWTNPCGPYQPLLGIQSMVTREGVDDGEPVGPSQRITAREALAVFTLGSADIIGLVGKGVSDRVIQAMQSTRQNGKSLGDAK